MPDGADLINLILGATYLSGGTGKGWNINRIALRAIAEDRMRYWMYCAFLERKWKFTGCPEPKPIVYDPDDHQRAMARWFFYGETPAP